MDYKFDVVCQLGSQVMYETSKYKLAPHTRMRTAASAIVLKTAIAPRLMVLGGSNFGIRYDDNLTFNNQHPKQKNAVFTFEAFANSDYNRKSEAAVIKDVLVGEFDIPSSQVVAETVSATTEENVAFLAIMLKRRPMFTGNEKIGILTLLYHMERAFPIFQKAGLNVAPIFAENVLCKHDPTWFNKICEYYSTPKGGKQYDVARIRRLLIEDKSLEEIIMPYWRTTVIDGNYCADGTPEEIEKISTRLAQAWNKSDATLRLHVDEKFIKGPFETLEEAQNA